MIPLTKKTPWAFRLLGAPPRIYVSVRFVFGIMFMGSLGIYDSALSTCLSRLERIGVIGPEIGLLLGRSAGSGCGTADPQALDVAPLVCRLWMWCSSTKTRKKKGRRGASVTPVFKHISF